MRTKVVYILVSSPADYYTEQTVFSMASLRKHNPAVKVSLVCDRKTYGSLAGARALVKEMTDEVIVRDFPETIDPKRRSRILKTTLREIVSGDYLFLDSDTVVCRSLEEIDSCDFQLGMAYDCNRKSLLDDSDRDTIERCSKICEASIKGMPYFNSGVILARDTAEVHSFYHEWHKEWDVSQRAGVVLDQPALCIANINSGLMIGGLDASWNSQIKYSGGPEKARIIHYFNPSSGLEFHDSPAAFFIFEEIRRHGLKAPYLTELLERPYDALSVLLQIKKDSLGSYCSRDLLVLWFSRPRLFMYLNSLSKFLKSLKF